jgi:hypothetical protein
MGEREGFAVAMFTRTMLPDWTLTATTGCGWSGGARRLDRYDCLLFARSMGKYLTVTSLLVAIGYSLTISDITGCECD